MEIGKPQRIHRVEPVKDPIPQKREPAPEPFVAPRKPEKVTAR